MHSRAHDTATSENGAVRAVIPEAAPRDVTSSHREMTPEQADLIAKITQVPLTPDGYRTLNLMIEHLRQREP